ncbi:MAG: MBL fold metallo-hydrolase [Acidobacteria bacterium]|nr:MBL fold metallo-hydrolase [Acidobacteriota bacterium]
MTDINRREFISTLAVAVPTLAGRDRNMANKSVPGTIGTQIFPNVYEIQSEFGNRYIQQYLFVGTEKVVLLDAGVAKTPDTSILPYLETLGISPKRISMVVAMHSDADHHGGLPYIKDASSSALLACHRGDQHLIESPEFLYQHRYNFLAADHQLGFGREGMVNCPRECKMDVLLKEGDVIELSQDWKLEVWHVPGHSDGHLAMYDAKNKAAFTSDAVQEQGYPTTDGKWAFGPTYYTVDAYLSTIHFLENKPIEHMYSGHWPDVHGEEVRQFLGRSRNFVEAADDLIKTHLKSNTQGVTLKQIIHAVSPKLGTWPDNMAEFLQFAIYGHMVRLEQQKVVRLKSGVPVEYILV